MCVGGAFKPSENTNHCVRKDRDQHNQQIDHILETNTLTSYIQTVVRFFCSIFQALRCELLKYGLRNCANEITNDPCSYGKFSYIYNLAI